MKSLAVRVLGDFGVDGVEPHALGSKKARAALHLLALAQGHCVRSDLLIDALWGDAPPSSPEDQLAVLMSRLRSVLGRDRIEHRDGGYLVRYDWLDAAELAALTDEMDRRHGARNIIGAAAAARIALTLVGSADPAPAAGEWAQVRAAGLARLISRARRTAAADDVEGSAARLAEARELLAGDLVFGWRLDCKHRLISGRLALHRDEPELAKEHAVQLEAAATALGVPRYACVARLLRHRADRALSLPVDLAVVEADLDELDRAVAIEAWWWTGDLAADFANRVWLDRAADRARRLANHAGPRADLMLAVSQRRLAAWAEACG